MMSTITPLFQIKRGDTYILEALMEVDGAEPDVTGWEVKTQIRRANRDRALVVECITTWVDPTIGRYHITVPAGTADWPLETLLQDIQYTSPVGQVVSTETFAFEVVEDITR